LNFFAGAYVLESSARGESKMSLPVLIVLPVVGFVVILIIELLRHFNEGSTAVVTKAAGKPSSQDRVLVGARR